MKEIAEDIREVQNEASRFGVAARDGSVQRIQGIEKEMGIDLSLKCPQLRLGYQLLHLKNSKLLHMFDQGNR
jgi:hypothetical protein